MLVICEDAHWIDPTTLEMFGLLIERVQKLALLFDDPSAGVQPGLDEAILGWQTIFWMWKRIDWLS